MIEFIIYITFILIAVLGFIDIIFEPEVDTLKNGDKVIWYNSGGRFGKDRDYFIYKRYGRDK